MLRALTYSESIFNGIIMIILDVGIRYDLCGLDCQKEGKKSTGTLRLFSHVLDPLGFGVWQLWYQCLGYDSLDFENRNWFWSKSEH